MLSERNQMQKVSPSSNAVDVGSVPRWVTKIPHTVGQLNPHAAATDRLHATMKTQCSPKKSHILYDSIYTMFRIDKFIEMANWTLSGVEGKRE